MPKMSSFDSTPTLARSTISFMRSILIEYDIWMPIARMIRTTATFSAMQYIQNQRTSGFTGLQVLGFVLAATLVTAGLTYWVVRTYILPSDFVPVELSEREQVQLDSKLRALGIEPPPPTVNSEAKAETHETHEEWLRPEPYSEAGAKREVGFSEREINALLSHNTDLARKLAIDLSDDLASARLLIPVDPDFPILGGRTLRVAAGLELSYGEGRPVVIVRGVSLMGVPIPNAWLGNLKNVDLVREFGGGPGVWKGFADGVEFAQIREGELKIKLKE
jgi:hypothetical protein